MDKRELIEALVEVLGEESWPELQSIVNRAIEVQRTRLVRLQQLSAKLAGGSVPVSPEKSEEAELFDLSGARNGTAKKAIFNIMSEAGKPLGNEEIRKRYYVLYGKEISMTLVGNTLWRDKGKIYQNSGHGRWTKWELIKGG